MTGRRLRNDRGYNASRVYCLSGFSWRKGRHLLPPSPNPSPSHGPSPQPSHGPSPQPSPHIKSGPSSIYRACPYSYQKFEWR